MGYKFKKRCRGRLIARRMVTKIHEDLKQGNYEKETYERKYHEMVSKVVAKIGENPKEYFRQMEKLTKYKGNKRDGGVVN